MATAQTSGFISTITSSADLSAKEYYFCSAAGALASDGGRAIGTIMDGGSASGDAVLVQTNGIAKMFQAEDITVGEQVASDTNGKAVGAAAGDVVIGICIESGGAASTIGTLLLHAGAEKNA
jgi:hypothetical protein